MRHVVLTSHVAQNSFEFSFANILVGLSDSGTGEAFGSEY